MKFDQDKAEEIYSRRSPHGERGLKLHILARRAERFGRSPHGERGLKFLVVPSDRPAVRRSPHGERGLKSPVRLAVAEVGESLSSRRAWIEIQLAGQWWRLRLVALLTESVD